MISAEKIGQIHYVYFLQFGSRFCDHVLIILKKVGLILIYFLFIKINVLDSRINMFNAKTHINKPETFVCILLETVEIGEPGKSDVYGLPQNEPDDSAADDSAAAVVEIISGCCHIGVVSDFKFGGNCPSFINYSACVELL